MTPCLRPGDRGGRAGREAPGWLWGAGTLRGARLGALSGSADPLEGGGGGHAVQTIATPLGPFPAPFPPVELGRFGVTAATLVGKLLPRWPQILEVWGSEGLTRSGRRGLPPDCKALSTFKVEI